LTLRRFFSVPQSDRRGQEILSHVAATTEARLELFQDKEDFAVITAGFLSGFDVHRPDFSSVLSGGQVGARAIVRVIEPKPSRAWGKGDPPLALCRNKIKGVPSSAAPSTSTETF
jgi:hypothetical protein